MENTVEPLKRREFLKRTSLGSLAMATLPGLAGMPAAPAKASFAAEEGDGNKTNWIVAAIENAQTVGGVAHRILFEGHGFVTPGEVVGHGSFVHIDNATAVPRNILASGTWKARSLTSSSVIGTYGSLAAGLIQMQIDLVEDLPAPAVVSGVTLRLVCNIPAAGLFTGEDEGFVLTIPGSDFGSFTTPVVVGGTVYSILDESRDSPGN